MSGANARILDCTVCYKWIEIWDDTSFDYLQDGTGPFCERCWKFGSLIDKLQQKVAKLEDDARREYINRYPDSFIR